MNNSTSTWIARRLAYLMVAMALCTVEATAQQTSSGLPSYDVELIIFRHLATNNTEEAWSLESAIPEQVEIPEEDASPFETPSLAQPTVMTHTFPALPASKLKLTALNESLRRSRNYQPIAHVGWTQPGFARDSAPFLPINTFVPAATGVSGQVALSRGRYLHLTLDLTYSTAAQATEPAERFVLRQSRRMRSTERHYMDHPRFGVIAVVTPSGQ
jgi:Peptidoglycan-binding protein, CsiV